MAACAGGAREVLRDLTFDGDQVGQCLAAHGQLAARYAELRNRDLLIEKLKHQLAGLHRQRFGATSEALDQLELGLEDEEIARAAEAVPEPVPAARR